MHKLRKKATRRRLAVRLPAAARTARAADVHTAGAAAAKLRRTHAEFSDAAAVLRAAAGAIPGAATDYTRARCAEKLFRVSAVFLITAILFSANLLFQIIASLFPQDPAYIVNQIYSNLPYEMQFIISPGDLYSALSDAQSGTTVGTVIGMLITGGLMAAAYWITYISAKNPSIPAAKTAGLTIMKVFSIISLVVMSLAEVLCVVLAVIFGVALADNDYGYMDEMMIGFFIILIAACIIGFVVLIFEIIYEAKVIKMLNSAKNAMLTGMVPNKASMFVAVICFISAAVSFFSVFGDAVLYGWIRVPLGLTSVALNVLYGLLVLQFNKMLKNAGMAR